MVVLFPEVAAHLDVGHGSDLGQLEAVASPLQVVAGGEDVGVIAEDVGEDGIVVIVRDEPIDLPFDGAERQLPQAHVRDELLPGIHVVGDGLLVAEADDEGLGPQGRRLVAGGEPARQQVGLQPENLVGEVGQGFVDADRFLGDQRDCSKSPRIVVARSLRARFKASSALRKFICAAAAWRVSLPPVLIT